MAIKEKEKEEENANSFSLHSTQSEYNSLCIRVDKRYT